MALSMAKITMPVAQCKTARVAKAVKPVPRVQNAPKVNQMMVWTPLNNKVFETFSFLPPLSQAEISRQVDYIVSNGWTPCLEFADEDGAYIQDISNIRFGNASAGFYDNRYWTMWKLPMFGCSDPSQVLSEISQCTRAFPDSYIRLVAFDNISQVQVIGFLVHRPPSAREYTTPDKRSVK